MPTIRPWQAAVASEAEFDILVPGAFVSPDRVKGNAVKGATGFIRIEAAGANVADTVTVTSPGGGAQVYTAVAGAPAANEWDQSGTPAQEAVSLLAAIAVGNPDVVADTPAQDTAAIFLRVDQAGTGALTLAESTAGARIDVRDYAGESVGEHAVAVMTQVADAVDVTLGPGAQGLWRFDPGFATIVAYHIDILTAVGDYTRIAWTGAPTIVTIGGRQVLELANAGGAVDIVAGCVINVVIFGTVAA